MTTVDREWLNEFDQAMLGFFAIDHAEAGMDSTELARYCNMPPREAALAYGEDYDLCRVDTYWPALDHRLNR